MKKNAPFRHYLSAVFFVLSFINTAVFNVISFSLSAGTRADKEAKLLPKLWEEEQVQEQTGAMEAAVMPEMKPIKAASAIESDVWTLFPDAGAYSDFVKELHLVSANGGKCVLQEEAAQALEEAIEYAKKLNISVFQNGSDACLRDYGDTVRLWNIRVRENLSHYVSAGRISAADAEAIRKMALQEQAEAVTKLEREKGLLFGKGRTKSIHSSAAVPGSSTHLIGLAFDLKNYDNALAVHALNRFGWYQLIPDDWPHFVYMGKLSDEELSGLGLVKMYRGDFEYWQLVR